MNGLTKKILATGLTVSILSSPIITNVDLVYAKGPNAEISKKVNRESELASKQAIDLVNTLDSSITYIQNGGIYKKGEYRTLIYKGKKYRYLSSSIDTKQELITYLKKIMTQNSAEQLFKDLSLIEYKSRLIQVEADGGSLLQWGKSSLQVVKTVNNARIYRFFVPIGETGEKQSYLVEFQYDKKSGWKISKKPTQEQNYNLNEKQAALLAKKLSVDILYVLSGGQYREGEYKTFSYLGKTYRYLSSDIVTKKELYTFLAQTMTTKAIDQFIKNRGIIEYRGKMAQIEADGGSLLQWDKTIVQHLKTENLNKYYHFVVPVGDTGESKMYVIEYIYDSKIGWRIAKEPRLDSESIFTEKQAQMMAVELMKTILYVQNGGHYQNGEYKTFTYSGKTYRYLSSDIDVKTELLSFLKRSLTEQAAFDLIGSLELIEYKGKMAQIEADGGSILAWDKASVEHIKSEKYKKYYRFFVPFGDSGSKQNYIIEFNYDPKIGWRIANKPVLEQVPVLSNSLVHEIVTNLSKSSNYVQSGGAYHKGEYRTFPYNGKTYRYLSSSIDTRTEILNYLKTSLTHTAAEEFINNRGIIEHQGKLAQVEADGGSLLLWERSLVTKVNTNNGTEYFRLVVPNGDTSVYHQFIVEFQYDQNTGWLISKEPYKSGITQ